MKLRSVVLAMAALAIIGSTASLNVWAVTGIPTVGTEATQTQIERRSNALITDDFLEKKLALSYSGEFYGPSVDNPFGYERPIDGSRSTAVEGVYLYNTISVGYKLSSSAKAVVIPRFNWAPGVGDGYQNDATLLDPRVGVSDSKLISSGNFNMYGAAQVELGVTTASRERNKLFAPRVVGDAVYSIPSSRFSLGSIVVGKVTFYTSNEDENVVLTNPTSVVIPTGIDGRGSDVNAAFAPYLTYQLSSTIAPILRWELNTKLVRGTTSFQGDGTPIKFLVSVDSIPRVNLTPYIAYDTSAQGGGGEMGANTTFGAELSASFF